MNTSDFKVLDRFTGVTGINRGYDDEPTNPMNLQVTAQARRQAGARSPKAPCLAAQAACSRGGEGILKSLE